MNDRMCDRVDCAAEPKDRWWEEAAYRVVSFFDSSLGYHIVLLFLSVSFWMAIGLIVWAVTR